MIAGLWIWLVGKVGDVFARIIAGVALLLLAFMPFYLTWHAGWNDRDAQAAADANSAQTHELQQLVKFSSEMQVAVGDYVLRRGQDRLIIQTIKQEIPHVVTVYKTAPDAEPKPLPQCVFTTGFVRLWNSAVEDSPAPSGSDGADSIGTASDVDLYDSGIGQEQILDNHVDNASIGRELRRRLKLAQDYIKTLQHLEGNP